MNKFTSNNNKLRSLIETWEPRLLALDEQQITQARNQQQRNIKQILGHMVDSASNNTHRIIHLQYQASPLVFPDYANLGNNDRWIAIQNYEGEPWEQIVQLWKYANLHLMHVIDHVDTGKLKNVWLTALNEKVSLREMITDYLRHVKLHLAEIEELMGAKS